jgi:hypothetical protein
MGAPTLQSLRRMQRARPLTWDSSRSVRITMTLHALQPRGLGTRAIPIWIPRVPHGRFTARWYHGRSLAVLRLGLVEYFPVAKSYHAAVWGLWSKQHGRDGIG